MHQKLHAAILGLGISDETTALAEAMEFSEAIVEQSRTFLQEQLAPGSPFDIVVLGSIARGEATAASDLDYLVVTHGLFDDPAQGVRTIIEAMEELRTDRLDLTEPGATGIFGKMVAAQDLVERVGLQEDTNLHHTRRTLLLTESVSIFNEDLHEQLLRAVIRRYLASYDTPKPGVPRFLLNDVLRYWRTLAVDYQAKQWGTSAPEWGLRYLKLIISRKLMIAGTVASLFLCEEATDDYLVAQCQMPALARVAQLYDVVEDRHQEDLATILKVASEFIGALGDGDFRTEATSVRSKHDIAGGSTYDHLQQRARDLQAALERIFFDDPLLRDRSRKYLSF